MESEAATTSYGLVVVVLTLLYGVLGLSASLWCWYQWKSRKILRVARNLPLVRPAFPLIGHAYMFFFGWQRGIQLLFNTVSDAVERGIKITCFWTGPIPYFFVLDASLIQVVLSSAISLDKADEYLFFTDQVGTDVGPVKYSIANAPADRWKVTRRHLNSLFTPRNLQQLIPTFNKTSRELLESLAGHVGQGRIDLLDPILVTTLKTIMYLLFGKNIELDTSKVNLEELVHVVEVFTDLFAKRAFQPWLRAGVFFRLVYGAAQQKVDRTWRNFTEFFIKATNENIRRKNEKTVAEDDNQNCEETLTIVDVFSSLQEKYPVFTDADFRAEIQTLYATGFDTVGNMLSYCFMALAQHEDIQDKVYQEILSVVGTEREVTFEDLGKLHYIEQVLMETMRRFTLVPLTMRKATQDLELGSCTIPSGSSIVLCMGGGVHMDPKIYPDPERFDPARFSPETTATRDRSSFMAFSGGPRDCIGKVYAMYLMKVIVVHVLRAYRVRPVLDVFKLRLKYKVVASSLDGFPVLLKTRT